MLTKNFHYLLQLGILTSDERSFTNFIENGEKLGVVLATSYFILIAFAGIILLVRFKQNKEDKKRYIARHKWYLVQLALGKLANHELLNSIETPIVKANRVTWRHEITKRYYSLLPVEVNAFSIHRRCVLAADQLTFIFSPM